MKSLSLDSNLDVLDIYSKLLRIAAALLTPSVTRILNNSRISGIMLQDWKITRVHLCMMINVTGLTTDQHHFSEVSA